MLKWMQCPAPDGDLALVEAAQWRSGPTGKLRVAGVARKARKVNGFSCMIWSWLLSALNDAKCFKYFLVMIMINN